MPPRAAALDMGENTMPSSFRGPAGTGARYPQMRMRRMRANPFSRALMRETRVTPADLIYPVFVHDRENGDVDIPSMPGVKRLSLSGLARAADAAAEAGIPALALFPVIEDAKKSPKGDEALNPEGLVPRALRRLKASHPRLGLIGDVALDPFTSHGQDGVIDEQGRLINDETCAILARQAVVQASAGADLVAPSDMMDGRVGVIRAALDAAGKDGTMILAYAAKYASAFYGPFRDAVGSKGALGKADKRTYQMDPGNSDEALREVALDLAEGADLVMVKPALAYLDIVRRVKDAFGVPVVAYHVSGEYAMLKAAAERGWLDERATMLETLACMKRAGVDAVLTYAALDLCRWLAEDGALT
jgi:porphobilinogen synthase